ncbi:MAG: hypothetical protein HXX20_12375 [Chloroflexi bacterium]|nr:hypothetical protein [Chloroflexota bacterium]
MSVPVGRRFVVYGRMPLPRTPQSGWFTTRFKEDAFFIGFDEQALLFNEGARTEQSLQLPLYYIEKVYYEKKKQVETLGLTGGAGRVEIYMQYARLPILDPHHLRTLREDLQQRVEVARETLLEHQNSQALFSMLRLQLCDEPILFFDYDRQNYSLRIKARAPLPVKLPEVLRTKRERINLFREYEDLLCSKAVSYALNAFEALPFLQEVTLTLIRMEPKPAEGLLLFEEQERQKKVWQLRRSPDEAVETPAARKKREEAELKLLKQQEKEAAKRKKEQNKSKRELEMTTRAPDGFDELFDGSLPYESILLSARIPRQAFMDLSRSKMSYSARQALEQFELRLKTDEEQTSLFPVESLFQIG